MRRKSKLPELLAPAGDFECLVAAVAAGADAVYLGGKSFGARAFAKNFDIPELTKAVSYCHLHGVRLFVTVNTLVYDRELSDLSDYIDTLWQIGVDAIIACDLGTVREIRNRTPDMEIHASTQMSVHNTDGADAAYSLGACRAVVARELSLENIKSVVDNSKAEIEVFLHGALCVCHSGQCLMSSLVGGRSGNRGECAQPCRLPYNGGAYPLSLKDLSLAGHIKELCDAGVASLKIEGRMKSPEYVYTVTSIYRRLLDEYRDARASEEEALRRVFSRNGFTDGYLTGKLAYGMTGVRTEKDKEITKALAERKFEPQRAKVTARVEILKDKPAKMELISRYKTVVFYGDVPAEAQNAPLTDESVRMRLSKMGNTLLSLSPDDIELHLDEGLNMSPSSLNALRRGAAEAMECSVREATGKSHIPPAKSKGGKKPLKTALFFNTGALASCNDSSLSLLDIIFAPLTKISEVGGKANGVYIPPVIFDTQMPEIKKMLAEAAEQGIMYALVGNIGHIDLAEQYGFEIIGDFRLNTSNTLARQEYGALGVKDLILSPELTLPMSRDIGGGVVVYGRIPLMLTERCFMKDSFGCDKCGACALTDRTGAKFPMIREYSHRNIILNSAITYMGDRKAELASCGITNHHFIFSVETSREIESALAAYKNGAPLNTKTPIRRMGKR